MIKRIIDKETKLFLRDDFTFNDETEIGLEVEPSQGLYAPKWDGGKWIETGIAPETIPPEPTIEDRVDNLENTVIEVLMLI